MKIAIFNTKEFERPYLESANENKHTLKFIEDALSLNTLALAKDCDAICIFVNDDASDKVLEKLNENNIHHITVRAAGYDNVGLKKAKELNFSITNVPEYSPHSIAEHTVALILAMNRKIVRADHKVKDFDFSLDDLVGFDLNGKQQV